MKLAAALVLLISPARANHLGPIITEEALKRDVDPVLVAAVIYGESRFKYKVCHRGAHGLMQIQLKNKSCSPEAIRKAKALGLYHHRINIRKGVRLMRIWKDWKERNNPDEDYHWLLHYNQGFGKCTRHRKRCMPIRTGRIGEYAEKVLSIYRQLQSARDEV